MDRSFRMKDVGWCWDGQAINGQTKLSIFGTGMGTRWFGLSRCCHMFHENNALALDLLTDMEEIICDVSKWDHAVFDDHPKLSGLGWAMRCQHDGRIERKVSEAATVGKLAKQYHNVTGLFDDDLMGKIKNEGITPERYADVRAAARAFHPDIKLWGVVYTHELNPADWDGFQDLIDVINLWVWKSEDLEGLEEHVAACRDIFPNTPIVMGCYLRDFTLLDGVPMDRLKLQWETTLRLLHDETLAGYSVLGGFLIDSHEEQARWVKDFIAAN